MLTIYMNVINNMRQTNGDRKSKMNQVKWLQNSYSCELCSDFFSGSATINYVMRNLIYIKHDRLTFRYSAFGFFFLFSFPFISVARWIDRRKPHEMPWSIQIEVNKREWKKVFDVQRRKSRLFRIVEEKKWLMFKRSNWKFFPSDWF